MSKGAFPYTGTKLSSSRGDLKTKPGRMSGAHGTNTGNKYHGVCNAGPTTVGKDCRPFKSGLSGVGDAGLEGGSATRHAKQPGGHKDKA